MEFPRSVVAPPTPSASNNSHTLTFPTSNVKDPISHKHKKHFLWKVVAPSLVVGLIIVVVVMVVKKYLHHTSIEVPTPITLG